MLLLCAELRDEPLQTHLALLFSRVRAITHHGTPRAPAEALCRNHPPGLQGEKQGCSSYVCTKKPTLPRTAFWLGMMLAFGVRLVDLGQNLLEMMLRVFQYKGTFASVAVTCAALMPCSGHRSVFRGTGTVEKVRLLPAAWLKRTAGFGGPLGG